MNDSQNEQELRSLFRNQAARDRGCVPAFEFILRQHRSYRFSVARLAMAAGLDHLAVPHGIPARPLKHPGRHRHRPGARTKWIGNASLKRIGVLMSRLQWTYTFGFCGSLLLGTAWGQGAPAAKQPPATSFAVPVVTRAVDLSQLLVPPAVVIQFAQDIHLDAPKLQEVLALMQEVRPKVNEAQQKLHTDTEALAELLKAEKADVPACLIQLDKVLDDERTIKRLNFEAWLKVRNLLPAGEFSVLMGRMQTLRDNQAVAGGPPETLRTKLQQVQELAQQRQQEGKDLSRVRHLMVDAKTAAGNSDYKGAEEALDKALQLLNQ